MFVLIDIELNSIFVKTRISDFIFNTIAKYKNVAMHFLNVCIHTIYNYKTSCVIMSLECLVVLKCTNQPPLSSLRENDYTNQYDEKSQFMQMALIIIIIIKRSGRMMTFPIYLICIQTLFQRNACFKELYSF